MKNGHTHLFIPGPTNIPEAVRQAMNVPMQDMRAPDFGELTKPLFAGLKRVYKTELIKRSALMKIIAAWLITVPVSGALAALIFYTIRGFMLP